MMRPQGGQAQQPPSLVNHYLVPARTALLSPSAPTRPMAGPLPMQRQLPIIAPKQSDGASGMTPPHGAGMISQQGVGLSPPRQRFPPPFYQRNVAGQGQYGKYEPRHEKTGLRGFRSGTTQTTLYSHRRWLEP